ncbi:hypothetical protein LTR05_007950 [Lithohypha guttulata]|uniref:Uncharacterized protein n=1 Tax=Lithohypha guttulata TaxID=1690604 RepID=A0AAN7YCY3_9EURO|nr:hypothetical protein LTR05_007950 [Lithohypha guttulata]
MADSAYSTNVSSPDTPKVVTIRSATTDQDMLNSHIETMTMKERQNLTTGSKVVVTIYDQETRTQHQSQPIPLKVLKAAFNAIDSHLKTLEAQGKDLSKLDNVIVEVPCHKSFFAIMAYLKFSIIDAKGALSDMRALPNDEMSLIGYMHIGEVAVALGFRHVLDQMKEKILRTFYRGPGHRYRLPIQAVRALAGNNHNSQFSNMVRDKLVSLAAQPCLEHNLINKQEVEDIVEELPRFGDRVYAEHERLR